MVNLLYEYANATALILTLEDSRLIEEKFETLREIIQKANSIKRKSCRMR